MTSFFTPGAPKLFLRVDTTVASAVADLIATSRKTEPPAPLVDAVVIEAQHLDALKELRVVLRDAGVPLWVDPMTVFWQSETEPEFGWNDLSFAGAPQLDFANLSELEIADLARLVVDAQVRAGANAVIAPYLYADKPDDPAFEMTRQFILAAARYMDDVGLRPGRRLVAVFAGSVSGFGPDAPRETAIARFASTLAEAGVGSVATLIGPTGKGDESAVKIQRLFNLHRDLKNLPTVSEVVPLRQGLFGEALVAIGMDGYETGINVKERCDIKGIQNSRKKPRDPNAPSGSYHGLYIEDLHRSVPLKKAALMLENPTARGQVACMDVSCCPHGVKSMQRQRAGHAIRRRSQELSKISSIPQPQWRIHHVQRAAKRAFEVANNVNGVLKRIDTTSKSPYQVPTRGYESLETVLKHWRETEHPKPLAA